MLCLFITSNEVTVQCSIMTITLKFARAEPKLFEIEFIKPQEEESETESTASVLKKDPKHTRD